MKPKGEEKVKQYYDVYENAIFTYRGKKVRGNRKILTTKSRKKALELYEKNEANRWVEQITDHGSGETTEIIAE
jgi:hypothetical protein